MTVATTAAAFVLGLAALLAGGPNSAEGAVPDCATAPNARSWDGPAAGNWGTPANWAGDVLPGQDEVACIGDATVALNIAAEVDAVVSGPAGTISMPSGFVLTLSPANGEQSQIANLVGPRLEVRGAGNVIVTHSFAWGGPGTIAGPTGSTLTLAASVGSNASVGSGFIDGRILVVENGVTVTQSPGGIVNGSNGGSIENGGVWNATGDGAALSALAPSAFRNTPTGILRKTSGTGSTTVGPVDNDGLIENLASGTIVLSQGGSSDGTIDTGPTGTIQFQAPGAYTVAGGVSGAGTVRVVAAVTFSGAYSAFRTETQGGGAVARFDTSSPQTLPELALGSSTVIAGSADLVVTESFTFAGRIEGPSASLLTLAPSVGANAAVSGGFIDRRTLVVADGVTVTQPGGIINPFNGGSIENRGIWDTTGDAVVLSGQAPSEFRNTATGILRKSGGTGSSSVSVPRVVNDGLIENLSGGTLSLGRFPGLPVAGTVTVGDLVASGPVLTGSGRLAPAVRHSFGIVSPGSSPGAIEVIGLPGSWESGSSAGDPPTLQIEIGGTGPSQFDKLALGGAFTLPATGTRLALSTLPGYQPVPGDEFPIVEASSVTGTFASVTGTDLGNGLSFQVAYAADRVVVTVVGTPINARPDAVDDAAAVDEDAGATPIDVLSNDTDPEDDLLEIVANTQPANGSATCTASDCTYTPDPDFNGADSFTYRIADVIGSTDTATVTVAVTPVNDDPTATDDTATVEQGSAGNELDVLANDGDVDGDTLQVTAVGDPANGSAAVASGGGSVVYTPDPGFNGADSFTYMVSDGNGGSATASISVDVSPNTPPDAVDDTATVDEDSTGNSIPVLANDTDADGDALMVASATTPANGTVSVFGDGTGLAYTPNPNFNGGDTFAYTISDGRGGTDTATATITVSPTNDVPTAVDDLAAIEADSGASAVDVLANDADPDGDALSVVEVTQGVHGAVAIAGGGAGLTYAPNPGFSGADSFTYTISDGNGATGTASVSVTVTAPQVGTIEVVLDAQPDDGQDFQFVVSGSGQQAGSFSLDDDADGTLPVSQLVGPLPSGSNYAVVLSGTLPAGWLLTAIECDEAPVSTDLQAQEVVVGLDDGGAIRCTFTVVTGFVEVVLDAQPNDGQDFPFVVSRGGQEVGSFSLDDDAEGTLPPSLPVGPLETGADYTILVPGALPAGWSLTAIVCDEVPVSTNLPGQQVVVHLDPGDTIRCTFSVRREATGSLEVVLDTQPDDPQDFLFNGSPTIGAFSLDDDGDPALPVSRRFGALPARPTAYQIQLGVMPPGWRFDAIECTETPVAVNLTLRTVQIRLDDGDSVRCTFRVHRPLGSLEVVLDAQPDDERDFVFSGFPTIGTFLLDDDADPALPASRAFGPLPARPDVYGVRLYVLPSDTWRVDAIECTETPVAVNLAFGTVQVRLDDGDAVRCTFRVHRLAGSLEVVLDAQPDDPQDFLFSVTRTTAPSFVPFVLDDDTDPARPASRLFPSLPARPDLYTIQLAVVPAIWRLEAITCTETPIAVSLAARTARIRLDDGDAVRCTFVVKRPRAGKIAAVDTSCPAYRDGTAGDLGELVYLARPPGGPIVSVTPPVLRYLAEVRLPAGPVTIVVNQTRAPASPFLAPLTPLEVTLQRLENCLPLALASVSMSGGNVTISHPGTETPTVIVSISYTAAPLIGRRSSNLQVAYTLAATVNGAPSIGSSDSILLRPG
jgi:hypothetical protein